MINPSKTDELSSSDGPRLIRAADAARMVSISTRTLWRLVSANQFPAPVRVGGSTRWRRADVERWIADGCTDIENDPK